MLARRTREVTGGARWEPGAPLAGCPSMAITLPPAVAAAADGDLAALQAAFVEGVLTAAPERTPQREREAWEAANRRWPRWRADWRELTDGDGRVFRCAAGVLETREGEGWVPVSTRDFVPTPERLALWCYLYAYPETYEPLVKSAAPIPPAMTAPRMELPRFPLWRGPAAAVEGGLRPVAPLRA